MKRINEALKIKREFTIRAVQKLVEEKEYSQRVTGQTFKNCKEAFFFIYTEARRKSEPTGFNNLSFKTAYTIFRQIKSEMEKPAIP